MEVECERMGEGEVSWVKGGGMERWRMMDDVGEGGEAGRRWRNNGIKWEMGS